MLKTIKVDYQIWKAIKVKSAQMGIPIKTLAKKYIRQGLEKEKEEKK